MRLEIYAETMGNISLEFDGKSYLLSRAQDGGKWHLTDHNGNPVIPGSSSYIASNHAPWTTALGKALDWLHDHCGFN